MRLLHSTPLAILMACGLAACGEPVEQTEQAEATPASCEEARAHLQACFPEREAQIPAGCTEESAASINARSCEQLEGDVSADSKSDSSCNPWYWWLCSSGGSTPEPTGYNVSLNISVCETDLCVGTLFGENRSGAECGKITLENEAGDVVATDYINDYLSSGGVQDTGDGFRNLALPAGDYTARLWRRNGQQALTTKQDLAQIDVTLNADGSVDRSSPHFEILKTEADAVRACSDVIGSLTSTCNMEEMSKEDTEWGWIIHLEGTHSEGRYEDYKRASKYYMRTAHDFGFRNVRPGAYTITYIEMDVPGWSREINMDFEEYKELVERYATGNQLVESLEITMDDITTEKVELVGKDLEHLDCR